MCLKTMQQFLLAVFSACQPRQLIGASTSMKLTCGKPASATLVILANTIRVCTDLFGADSDSQCATHTKQNTTAEVQGTPR
jgi:hypothetical protein